MVKVLDLDGNIKKYYGEQCLRNSVESDGYGMSFNVIEFGDYGLDSLLIPIDTKEVKMDYSTDLTDIPFYVYRCETYYYKDFQEVIDEWYLVGETDITPDKIFEKAKMYLVGDSDRKYSRVTIERQNDRHFTIKFHPQMKEYQMREELKKMGYCLKRHKNSNGVNMYMIIKADNNLIYAGENFTMTEADVDRFIHE